MGRGKFKGKPTGRRQFTNPEDLIAGVIAPRPRTFKQEDAEAGEDNKSEGESENESQKQKANYKQGIIEIENPNLVKNLKAGGVDVEKTTELSRREREEIERQKAHERYMKLQEQGKTEQSRRDLERLALVRKQRAEASRKRGEERAAKEQKKLEARKPL